MRGKHHRLAKSVSPPTLSSSNTPPVPKVESGRLPGVNRVTKPRVDDRYRVPSTTREPSIFTSTAWAKACKYSAESSGTRRNGPPTNGGDVWAVAHGRLMAQSRTARRAQRRMAAAARVDGGTAERAESGATLTAPTQAQRLFSSSAAPHFWRVALYRGFRAGCSHATSSGRECNADADPVAAVRTHPRRKTRAPPLALDPTKTARAGRIARRARSGTGPLSLSPSEVRGRRRPVVGRAWLRRRRGGCGGSRGGRGGSWRGSARCAPPSGAGRRRSRAA